MNRFTRRIKENLLPFIIFIVIVVLCSGAWYFYHPSSPYHKRYHFVVSFQKVGTLSPGNAVNVRGIKRGQITKVELTDDAVYVTAEVFATTHIPVNSEYRLINSGLMGEREMCVLTGDSPQLIADGDTLVGFYDEGMTGVGQKLSAILDGAIEIRDSLSTFMDSLSKGSSGKKIDNVSDKAHWLARNTKSNVGDWKNDVRNLLDQCDKSLNSAQAALGRVSATAGDKINDVDELLDRTQELLTKVQELKEQSTIVVNKLGQNDNSAGLLLQKETAFTRELDNVLTDVDSLLKEIIKSGLKINIDIF